MSLTRPGSDQIAVLGRYAGVALVLAGLALAFKMLDQPAYSLRSQAPWGFVATAEWAITLGALVLATAYVLGPEHQRPAWAPAVGAFAVAGALALALKAGTDNNFYLYRSEAGFWGFLDAMTNSMPLALLLLLPLQRQDRPIGGPSRWGIYAGAAIVAVSLALGVHAVVESRDSSLWQFLSTVTSPVGLGLLLLIASLAPDVPDGLRKAGVIAAAAAVTIAGFAYAIHFADAIPLHQGWIFLQNVTGKVALALLILASAGLLRQRQAWLAAAAVIVATLAHALWLSTLEDITFDAWAFLYVAQSGLAYAALIALCAAITDRHRAEAPASGAVDYVSASLPA